jgi:hypothetical protein
MPVRQAQLGEAILKASSNFYNGLECLSGRGHGKFIQQPNHQIYMLFKETSGKKHQSAI